MNGIAIIPARGGSKRVPRKNLRDLLGRPMMQWPIQAALALPEVAEVIVSTDDDEIAELAKGLGASVYGRRPGHLSKDHVPTAPVIAHEIAKQSERAGQPEFVMVLYPTSIFITGVDLSAMVKRLRTSNGQVRMVMTASEFPAPVERAWLKDEGDMGIPLDPGSRNRQSSEFRKHYFDAGQAYVSSSEAWQDIDKGRRVATALYVLPRSRSWDINTNDDLLIAEVLMQLQTTSGPMGGLDGWTSPIPEADGTM